MINSLRAQIDEIQNHWSLRLYGVALALTHVWTFLYWNRGNFFVTAQSTINAEPVCFPFFPNCDLMRASLSPGAWEGILYLYLFLAILSALFFLNTKLIAQAFSLLMITTFMKLFLHMSNYNFMGNYHYMVYFVIFTFLFISNKQTTVKHLIVAFYIAAGSLKVNIDWLSGAAMIYTPSISGNLFMVSLYYVIFLELIFVFGLLSPIRWIRWAVILQLLSFHAFSWHIVGFFYPMIMFCLLSLLMLDEWLYWNEKEVPKNHLLNLFNLKTQKSTLIILGLFTIMQILPFTVVSDPSLSGAPRLSSLNMFDSKTECKILLTGKTKSGSIHFNNPYKNLGTRLQCDPLVFLNQANQLCRSDKDTGEIEKLDFTLFSKRITQTHYKKVLEIKDVCALKNPLWAEITEGYGQ